MMSAGLTFETAHSIRANAGLIGPNSVIQLAEALRASATRGMAEAVFNRAGFGAMLKHPPSDMIDEAVPATLFRALWAELGEDSAPDLAQDSGRRTADYVLANRIPKAAQIILRCLPARLSAPLLLKAIRKNAWTFAGSGTCTVKMRTSAMIEIKDNPLSMPDCYWHQGVFERLFTELVTPQAVVRHPLCRSRGDQTCRFEIDLRARPQTGDTA